MSQPAPGGTQAGWSGGDTGMTLEEQAIDNGREPLVAPRVIDPAGPKALATSGPPPPDAGQRPCSMAHA